MVELIFAIGIFVVVTTMLLTMFVYGSRAFKKGQIVTDTQKNARIVIDTISSELKQATTFINWDGAAIVDNNPPPGILRPNFYLEDQIPLTNRVIFVELRETDMADPTQLDLRDDNNFTFVEYRVLDESPNILTRNVYNCNRQQALTYNSIEQIWQINMSYFNAHLDHHNNPSQEVLHLPFPSDSIQFTVTARRQATSVVYELEVTITQHLYNEQHNENLRNRFNRVTQRVEITKKI